MRYRTKGPGFLFNKRRAAYPGQSAVLRKPAQHPLTEVTNQQAPDERRRRAARDRPLGDCGRPAGGDGGLRLSTLPGLAHPPFPPDAPGAWAAGASPTDGTSPRRFEEAPARAAFPSLPFPPRRWPKGCGVRTARRRGGEAVVSCVPGRRPTPGRGGEGGDARAARPTPAPARLAADGAAPQGDAELGVWRAPAGPAEARGEGAHGRRRRSRRAEGRPRGAVPAVGRRLLLPRASSGRPGAPRCPGPRPLPPRSRLFAPVPPAFPSSSGAPKWRRWDGSREPRAGQVTERRGLAQAPPTDSRGSRGSRGLRGGQVGAARLRAGGWLPRWPRCPRGHPGRVRAHHLASPRVATSAARRRRPSVFRSGLSPGSAGLCSVCV